MTQQQEDWREDFKTLVSKYKHGAWLDEALGEIHGFISTLLAKREKEVEEEIWKTLHSKIDEEFMERLVRNATVKEKGLRKPFAQAVVEGLIDSLVQDTQKGSI